MTVQVAVVAAFGCVAALCVLSPRLCRTVRPAVATWLLTVSTIGCAVSGLTVLTMLSLPALGRDDKLADALHLSPRILAKDSPVGVGLAAVCLAVVVVLVARAALFLHRQRTVRRAAAGVARSLGATDGALVVVADDALDAYAVAGPPGFIVATRGLLRTLPAAERQAVLAHERAHLRHRHHRHLLATRAAVALCPCLTRLADAAAFAVERWADEAAAAETSRATTASALARVAVTPVSRPVAAGAALAAGDVAVSLRMQALQAAPPRLRPARVAVLAVLTLVTLLAAGVVAGHTWEVFQLAAQATHKVFAASRRS